jgi:hypothetical protein
MREVIGWQGPAGELMQQATPFFPPDCHITAIRMKA